MIRYLPDGRVDRTGVMMSHTATELADALDTANATLREAAGKIDRLNAHCEKYRDVIHELLRMAQLVKIRPAEQSAFIIAVNLDEIRKKYGVWVDGNERGMTMNIPHEN